NWEAESEASQATRNVRRIEGGQRETPGMCYQCYHRDQYQHKHFQTKEVASPFGGERNTAHHKEVDNCCKNQRQRLPGYVEVQGALKNNLCPATGDIYDRGHCHDIAYADHNCRCNSHHWSKCFADKGNKRTG